MFFFSKLFENKTVFRSLKFPDDWSLKSVPTLFSATQERVPLTDPSVEHKDQTFSAPKIPKFKTQNPGHVVVGNNYHWQLCYLLQGSFT